MATPQEIGEKLRERRTERSLTIEEAAFATRIRTYYLKAIEKGDFSSLPSKVQGKGFIRAYAGYLGIDIEPLLTEDEPAADAAEAPAAPEPAPLPEITVESSAQAGAIFLEIGQKLRRHRELLGLSLDDVEKYTYLRGHYLTALEKGEFDKLPSPVQGRGMLSNYAEFLGLDANQVLLRYAEGLQAQLQARREAELAFEKSQKKKKAPRKREEESVLDPRPPSLLKRLMSLDALVGTTLVLFLVGFVIWGASRIAEVRDTIEDQPPLPTAPSIADVLLGAATPTGPSGSIPQTPATSAATIAPVVLPTEPAEAEITASGTITGTTGAETIPQDSGAVQVYIAVRQRAWMQVSVDGEVVFNDRVVSGSAYQFSGEERIEVLTGNGAALQIFYNQADMGPMGNLGEVAHQVYTRLGVETPVPTATSTGEPGGREPLPTLTPTGEGQ